MVFLRRCLPLLSIVLIGCESFSNNTQAANTSPPCSPEWNRMVEQQISTGDGHGHGPDIGSSEWYYVIHRKLRWPEPANPQPGSPDWCQRADQAIRNQK